MANPAITISILGDPRKFNRAADDVSKKTSGLKKKFAGLGTGIAGALGGLGLAAGIKSSVDAASDLSESISKVGVVFGESKGEIESWAKGASSSLGLSRQQALEAAGTFGNLFSAMKLGKPETVKMSKGIVGLASDLASFNNADPKEVLESLRAGLVGEAEPLRKFGINISAARIEQEAYRLGLAKTKDQLTAGVKAQASYSLIMQDSKKAQGDFARTSGGLANQQRILAAKFKDVQAQVGAKLVPIFLKLATIFTKHSGLILTLVGALTGLFVIAKIVSVVKTLQEAIVGVNLAMAANPVVLVIAGLVALGAAVFIAYQKFQPFRDVVDAVGRFFRDNWTTILKAAAAAILLPLAPLAALVAGLVVLYKRVGFVRDIVQTVFGAIVTIVQSAVTVVKGIIDVFIGVFTGDWGRAWDGIKQIASGALNALVAIIGTGLKVVVAFFVTLPAKILGALGNLAGLLIGKGADLIGGLLGGIISAWDAAWRWIHGIPDRVKGAIGDAKSILLDVGGNIVDGFVEGIKAAWHKVLDTIGGLASHLPGPIKKVLGIGSPSKVFRKIGQQTIEGLRLGIADGVPALKKAFKGVEDDVRVWSQGAIKPLSAVNPGEKWNHITKANVMSMSAKDQRNFARWITPGHPDLQRQRNAENRVAAARGIHIEHLNAFDMSEALRLVRRESARHELLYG